MLKIDLGEGRAGRGRATRCVGFKTITWLGSIALVVRPDNESSNEESYP